MVIGLNGKMQSGKDTVGKIIQYLCMNKKYPFDDNTKSFSDFCLAEEEYKNNIWKIKKFAYKLKQIASILTGIPIDDFEKEEIKNSYLGEEWNSPISCSAPEPLIDELGHCTGNENCLSCDFYELPKQLTVREFLQKLGTDAIRNNIHPDTWVNALMNEYKCLDNNSVHNKHECKYPNWICSDVRFPNEYDAIKKRNGIMIKVIKTFSNIPKIIGDECDGSTEQGFEDARPLHISETALDNHTFDYIISAKHGDIDSLIEQTKQILIKEKII